MSIFSDLCVGFDTWRTRYFDNQHESVRLTLRIAEGFRQHVGAPKTFKNADGNEKRYVVLCKATDIGDGKVRHEETTSPYDVLAMWDDGFYHFGVGLVVEVSSNTWPKQLFPIPMYFIIEDQQCHMHVTNRHDGEFSFPIDDLSNCGHMYDYMASILTQIFDTKPWAFAVSKKPIGFVPIK